jgi:hypothetical protein
MHAYLNNLPHVPAMHRYGWQLFLRTAYPKYQVSEQPTTTSQGGAPQYAKVSQAAAAPECHQRIKVFPLVQDSGELRIMVLNKAAHQDCNVMLYLTKAYGNATLQRMTSAGVDGGESDYKATVSAVCWC